MMLGLGVETLGERKSPSSLRVKLPGVAPIFSKAVLGPLINQLCRVFLEEARLHTTFLHDSAPASTHPIQHP